MSKFKQKISEIRNSMPRRTQWLLMAVAFVVVLILLTLLLGGKDTKKADIASFASGPVELVIDPKMLNWADTVVGEKQEQNIKVSATAPVIITNVEHHNQISGYEVRSTCKDQIRVDQKNACVVIISYVPGAAMPTQQATVTITWHAADADADMTRRNEIFLTLGAVAPVAEQKPVVTPTPKTAPKPVVTEPEEIEEDEEEFETIEKPKSVKAEIIRDIETIAPPVKTPTKKELTTSKKEIVIPDGCSDFAFPGYNNAGRQIGWVKPSGGAFYFHTFDDKDCSEPAGIYNPDNGIITDNSGRKIGTDADHIGFATITTGEMPTLSNKPAIKPVYRAQQNEKPTKSGGMGRLSSGRMQSVESGIEQAKEIDSDKYMSSGESVISSRQYDRQFILRQFKPIPATIVSDVRADPEALANNRLPVRATVDRNVYSDNGRNVIIPTGTLLLGYVDGELPGPYTSIGRMNIKWYQFILPNGVEFNFKSDQSPFSGDAQGRSGIPGYGSTDYLEQFFMPMLTAIVPAAVNLIAPISDRFVNQIDLDNNTVVQSGTVRSSELAKNQIITAWNQVAQKLMVDMMDNTVPPFTIAAGTRITVYSPVDLIVSCGEEGNGKKCALGYGTNERDASWTHSVELAEDGSWIGQVRSFAVAEYCTTTQNGEKTVDPKCKDSSKCGGYDYATLLFYCQSQNYQAINMARQEQVFKNQQSTSNKNSIAYIQDQGQQAYNEQVLGLKYNDDGSIENPFNPPAPAAEVATDVLLCLDNTEPDANGCCTGEIYTDMGDQGFNCCPESGGDCFPPMF